MTLTCRSCGSKLRRLVNLPSSFLSCCPFDSPDCDQYAVALVLELTCADKWISSDGDWTNSSGATSALAPMPRPCCQRRTARKSTSPLMLRLLGLLLCCCVRSGTVCKHSSFFHPPHQLTPSIDFYSSAALDFKKGGLMFFLTMCNA